MSKIKIAGLPDATRLAMEPLPATFSLISILGLITTIVFTISGRIGLDFGVAFGLVFGIMFLASMISITP